MSSAPDPSISAKPNAASDRTAPAASNQGALSIVTFGAEPAVAEIRPVAHVAVADAHEIGEAVARHVGEIDRLRRRRRTPAAAPRPRSRLCEHASAAAESVLRQRGMPGEQRRRSVIRTSACPSPARSTKRRFGSPQSTFGKCCEGLEWPPAGLFVTFKKTGRTIAEGHQIERAVTREVKQCGIAEQIAVRFLRDDFRR